MSMDNGWIKLHRKTRHNFLHPSNSNRAYTEYEAWEELLLSANYYNNNVLINGKSIEVERGQKLTSILKLSEQWKWSRKKTSNFLNLLEKEHQISQKRTSKYTLITIDKYDFYQGENEELEQQGTSENEKRNIKRTSEEHQKNTNKEVKELQERKEERKEKDIQGRSVGPNFIKLFENHLNVLMPNQTQMDIIGSYLDDGLDFPLIEWAFIEASLKNKNFEYVKGILKNCYSEGVKTLEQAEQRKRQREQERQQQQPQQKQKHTPKWLDPKTNKNEGAGEITEEQRKRYEENKRFLEKAMND